MKESKLPWELLNNQNLLEEIESCEGALASKQFLSLNQNLLKKVESIKNFLKEVETK